MEKRVLHGKNGAAWTKRVRPGWHGRIPPPEPAYSLFQTQRMVSRPGWLCSGVRCSSDTFSKPAGSSSLVTSSTLRLKGGPPAERRGRDGTGWAWRVSRNQRNQRRQEPRRERVGGAPRGSVLSAVPERPSMGKTTVMSCPPLLTILAYCAAHRSRAEGSSAHRNV